MLGVLIPIFVIAVLAIVFVIVYKKKIAPRKEYDEEENNDGTKDSAASSEPHGQVESNAISDMKRLASIDYSELVTETLIGEGITSSVYKGKWNGSIIAIKSVNKKIRAFNLNAQSTICNQKHILIYFSSKRWTKQVWQTLLKSVKS